MKQSESQEPAVARELRLAKDYWLQTIQPHIAGRRLHAIEFYVARHAHGLLQEAWTRAADWNRTEQGKRLPISVESLTKPEFRMPELLCADEKLTPEILAKIAAALMNKHQAELTITNAVRLAHELIVAAEQYVKMLPKCEEGIAAWAEHFDLAFGTIAFEEILQSNKEDSGTLPLLPPVQLAVQNDRPGKKADPHQLSITAIRTAVKNFLEQRKRDRSDITEGEEIKENNGIGLHDLCRLRWERFKRFRETRRSAALKRENNKSAKKLRGAKADVPPGAAYGSITAAKREK